MARIKVSPGFTPPSGSRDSSENWFLRNGVWVLSNGTIPIQPRTESQMLERAGFAEGSRQWAYDLSSGTKSSWDAAALAGTTGQQTMIGQQSCEWETGNVIATFPAPGSKPTCPALPSPVYNPANGDLEWDVTFPDASGSSTAWIAAQIRLSPGQAPIVTPGKIIWRGAAVDGTIDLSAGFAEAFGSAAVGAAGVDLAMRYGLPSDGW